MKFATLAVVGLALLLPLKGFAECSTDVQTVEKIVRESISKALAPGEIWPGKSGGAAVNLRFARAPGNNIEVYLDSNGPYSMPVCRGQGSIKIGDITVTKEPSGVVAHGVPYYGEIAFSSAGVTH